MVRARLRTVTRLESKECVGTQEQAQAFVAELQKSPQAILAVPGAQQALADAKSSLERDSNDFEWASQLLRKPRSTTATR